MAVSSLFFVICIGGLLVGGVGPARPL